MKTYSILLVFLVAFCGAAMTQGTLQFNQARLLEGSQGNCPTCWTVPAGKFGKLDRLLAIVEIPFIML